MAIIFAIAAVALTVAVLLFPGTATATPLEQAPKIPPKEAAGAAGGTLIDPTAALAAAGMGSALAAGAAAWTAVNFEIGKSLTGDTLGGVTGLVGGGGALSAGNVGNVGRMLGGEADQLLGGTKGGATSVVAQAGGFFSTFVGGLFGVAAGAGILTVALPVYAIVSLVSDIARLAWGQKGALDEYNTRWGEAETRFNEQMRTALPESPSSKLPWGTGDGQAHPGRYSWPLADGYMVKTNELNRRKWLKTPKGLGQSDAFHERFGYERGYFVGQNGAGPSPKSWGDATYALFRNADPATVETAQVNRVYGIRWKYTLLPVEQRSQFGSLGGEVRVPPDWITADMLQGPIQTGGAVAPAYLSKPGGHVFDLDRVQLSDFYLLTWEPQYRMETVIRDSLAQELVKLGSAIANIEAWSAWNAEPHGAFVGDLAHAKAGVDKGWFDGEVTAEGDAPVLIFEGKKFSKGGEDLGYVGTVPEAAPSVALSNEQPVSSYWTSGTRSTGTFSRLGGA